MTIYISGDRKQHMASFYRPKRGTCCQSSVCQSMEVLVNDLIGSPTHNPTVSVIIPVKDDEEGLRRCLGALRRQSYPASLIQILVVDNGSEGDIAWICDPLAQVTLLHESRPGSYAARNRGIEHAQGEILAFLDSDCIPSTNWLAMGINALVQDEGAGAAGGSIHLFPRTSRPNAIEAYEMVFAFPQASYVLDLHFSATANLFVRRVTFNEVGLFNSSMYSGGDRDWGSRAYRQGVRMLYEPRARVCHPARASLRDSVKKSRRVSGGSTQYLKQIQGAPSLQQMIVVFGPVLISPLRRVSQIVGHRAFPSRTLRLQVLFVFLVGHYAGVAERIRLWLGGSPRNS